MESLGAIEEAEIYSPFLPVTTRTMTSLLMIENQIKSPVFTLGDRGPYDNPTWYTLTVINWIFLPLK